MSRSPSEQQPHSEYDYRLADRIKSKLRESTAERLPERLETTTGIELCADEFRQGGFGQVGRYRDLDMGREVAVKFLNQDLGPEHRRRFFREIQITATLDHPGVVPVYGAGQLAGRSFYAMRFVDGQTLAEAIEQFHHSVDNQLERENPRFRLLIESFKAACTMIDFAHQQKGIWHRDIKPQNIMIDNGETIIVDWGLAKAETESESRDGVTDGGTELDLTRGGQYLGTPAYMAPEQALGHNDQIDSQTDIYGLGATLFELLTGHAPHWQDRTNPETKDAGQATSVCCGSTSDSETSLVILKRIGTDPPPVAKQSNPQIPNELNSICAKAMSRNKQDRYTSARQIADDIENWLVQSEVSVHSYSRSEKVYRWFQRNSKLAVVTLLASLLIAAITSISLISVSVSKRRTESALSRFKAERDRRIDNQLKAYVAATPSQAETLLDELRSFESEELELRVDRFLRQHSQARDSFRVRLIRLGQQPQQLLPLLQSIDPHDIERLSLLVHAIRRPDSARVSTVEQLWQASADAEMVTRCSVVLAQLAPLHSGWKQLAPPLNLRLVQLKQADVSHWARLLHPVRHHLRSQLWSLYDEGHSLPNAENQIAAEFLLKLFGNDMQTLVELIGPADPDMFMRLVGELEKSRSDARQPLLSWSGPDEQQAQPFSGSEELEKQIVESDGMIRDSFMICESMTWSTFQAIRDELQKLGYRPLRVQRYLDSDKRSRVASVWVRDDIAFLLEANCSPDRVAALIKEKRAESWVPDDLSTIVQDARISYTIVFRHDSTDRNEYRVLLGNSRKKHAPQSRRLLARGFRQIIYDEVVDKEGKILVTGLYRLDAHQGSPKTRVVRSAGVQPSQVPALSDLAPLDVRYGPQQMTSVWTEDRTKKGVVVEGTDQAKRANQWAKLAEQGFVPVAIDVRRLADDQANAVRLEGVSIWHRQVPTARNDGNRAMALSLLDDDSVLLNWLKRTDDLTVRTQLIHRLSSDGIQPVRLVKWLESPLASQYAGIRSAILQALGEYDVDQFVEISRLAVAAKVARMRDADDDPGVHNSATWLLQQWKQEVAAESRAWNEDAPGPWFNEKNGHLMIVIAGPVALDMGSRIPPDMGGAQETFHHRTIDRSFSISAHEVTWQQFSRFRPEHPGDYSFFYSRHADGSLNVRTPQNHVSWYRAVEYCNWLSKEAGIPEGQWCYLPNKQGKYGPGMTVPQDLLKRTGYRLPTEAEWEYAARAGTTTPRFFGRDPGQLGHYARYRMNSNIRTWTVGSLKPNELGLFDVYGNVWEWCHGSPDEPWPKFLESVGDTPGDVSLPQEHRRALRGGAFIMPAGAQRSAIRSFNRPINEQFTIGFRIARTINSANAHNTLTENE